MEMNEKKDEMNVFKSWCKQVLVTLATCVGAMWMHDIPYVWCLF